MAYRDFREFLEVLRKNGELIEVSRPVNLENEIGKALKYSYSRKGPGLIFSNTGKKYPLVAGIYSTRSKTLLAFEATEENILEKFLHGLSHPIAPKIVESALCQEVVLTGNEIDITEFPIPTYSPKDGGPFLTAGITVSKDPITGVPDIGHYRYQLNAGKDHFEGAIVIGVDPVIAYACQVQVPDDTNDWFIAGGLRREAVELVKCKTVNLEVPATAEVVIEFIVDFNNKAMEGPLGEFTGYYTPGSEKPIARITAITHRKNPYFQGLLTGKPVTENHILKQIPFEASFLNTMKKQFPTIEKVSIPPSGRVNFYTVISMKPRYVGEARHAILAAMSSNIRPKWVVVVDPDIDVHDSTEVEWALSFRVQPASDVIIIDELPSGPVDPSAKGGDDHASKRMSAIGIDATRPFGVAFPDVADVPGWREYDFPEIK